MYDGRGRKSGVFLYLEIKRGQTGNDLAFLPSICMTWKYLGQFRIIYSKIMKSTGASAALALLVLVVTAAKAHPNRGYVRPACGCGSSSNEPSAISSGAQIVTYGDPCFCKESLPYSIQVPQPEPTPTEERLKSYGYSVITPTHNPGRCLQVPIKIETPIEHKPTRDHLCGKSYGVSVQHEEYSPVPTYSFDCAIQKPVKVQKPAYRPSMSICIQHGEERVNPRYSPLPFAVQTPVEHVPHSIPKLTGLTAKVDRVLVPACEIDGCPLCNDVVQKKSSHKSYY